MTFNQAMKELKAMGTAQNRKIYTRHGAPEPMFGVSFANLGKLKKQIKVDQALAEELWSSGNVDAQILATMIADPQAMAPKQLDDWVKVSKYYLLQDTLSSLVAKTPHAIKKMEKWTKAKPEFVSMVGWNLLASLALSEDSLSDKFFLPYLEIIETGIHSKPNRTRHSMNMALVSIGCRNDKLEKRALAVAKKIGKVEVDHGETSCKTPDAASYIKKTREYRTKKAAKKKAATT